MILFVGQIARDMRDREAFQEVDYRAFFGPIAKWVTEIDNADRIPELVARAFQTAVSGRPGPIVIALPEDMLTDQTAAQPCKPIERFRTSPDPDAITRAATLLNAAERPLMIPGGGGWSDAARLALADFAEKTKIPVAPAFRSQDLLDNRSDNFIGDAGVGMFAHVREAIQKADVILAVNIRFGETVTDGWTLLDVPNPKQKIVHAHVSAAEIGKIYQPDVAIQGDPEIVITKLHAEITTNYKEYLKPLKDAHRKALQPMPAKGPLDMALVCSHLRKVLPSDAVITNGAGNFAIWSGRFIAYHGDMRLLGPQAGAMGAGVPAALAAKAADPGRTVVCFAGDGDFQMSVGELGAALQADLRPIFLIINNKLYGTIRLHQARNYAGRKSGTHITNPDFVALGRAYGFHAERVESSDAFPDAFARAAASSAGAVIELVVDPDDIAPNVVLSQAD